MAARKRVAVLISGRGSNLQALIDARQHAYEIALVASNNPDAEGLARARAAGVATLAIDHRAYKKDRQAFERELDAGLRAQRIDLVALAGFMRVLTPYFVRAWEGRMVNIHPSLLPLYPGLDTHARAIAAGDAEAGCTVHLVTEAVDGGPVLGQTRVPILPGDTPETLAARVLEAEHMLYARCLAEFAGASGSA
jgi:phosphoribosylglycinamide formyltransferase 1